MNRRVVGLVLAAALLLVTVALVVTARRGTRGGPTGVEPPEIANPVAGADLLEIELFFPGPGARLHKEVHRIPPVAQTEELAALIVEEILAGPEKSELRRPFPAETTLRGVDLIGRHAFVDLARPRSEPLATGSRQELLMLYSLVNSVALGVEGIDSVAILLDGIQPVTLAGHVDTTRPLRPSDRLVAGPS